MPPSSEIDKLRLIIKELQRGQFGGRSERLDPDQVHVGLEELDADHRPGLNRAKSARAGAKARSRLRRRR